MLLPCDCSWGLERPAGATGCGVGGGVGGSRSSACPRAREEWVRGHCSWCRKTGRCCRLQRGRLERAPKSRNSLLGWGRSRADILESRGLGQGGGSQLPALQYWPCLQVILGLHTSLPSATLGLGSLDPFQYLLASVRCGIHLDQVYFLRGSLPPPSFQTQGSAPQESCYCWDPPSPGPRSQGPPGFPSPLLQPLSPLLLE